MDYEVRTVSDQALPSDVQWVIVTSAGGAVMFIKEGALSGRGRCEALTRAWQAYQSVELQKAAS